MRDISFDTTSNSDRVKITLISFETKIPITAI